MPQLRRENQGLVLALAAIFSVVAEADRYFASQEPWALKKTNPERMETVLWTTAELVRRVTVLCQPFIPGSAAKLLDLGDPKIDWVSLAKGLGVPAVRCETAEDFEKVFAGAMAQRGPMFIEAAIG